MRTDTDNQRWLSDVILTASIPIYVCLCWPAIVRRGFPEIDPFWLAMPWLWIVPIILSGLFDYDSSSRKRSIIVYTFVSSFFFCGTLVFSIPRSSSFVGMILPTLFLLGPLNLVIAFIIEKVSQYVFRLTRLHENVKRNTRVNIFLPEKKNALVVINDQSIWIFAKDGQLLQSIDYSEYPEMKLTEDTFATHH